MPAAHFSGSVVATSPRLPEYDAVAIPTSVAHALIIAPGMAAPDSGWRRGGACRELQALAPFSAARRGGRAVESGLVRSGSSVGTEGYRALSQGRQSRRVQAPPNIPGTWVPSRRPPNSTVAVSSDHSLRHWQLPGCSDARLRARRREARSSASGAGGPANSHVGFSVLREPLCKPLYRLHFRLTFRYCQPLLPARFVSTSL